MIISITGKVKYPLTIDPTVWIFDDRKVKYEEAFQENNSQQNEEEYSFSSAERFDREVIHSQNQNPPISKKEGEEILQNTYIMPFKHFYKKMEAADDATEAVLVHSDETEESISLEELHDAFFLFAISGKAIKEDGPAHIYFRDGSNKDKPIKDFKKIIIK